MVPFNRQWGVGTLHESATKLKEAGVTTDGVIIVPCTIRAFKMQLAKGIQTYMGPSGLKQRYLLQTLYKACALQKKLGTEEWHSYIQMAAEWVKDYLGENPEKEDNMFQEYFDMRKTFKEKNKGQIFLKEKITNQRLGEFAHCCT